MRFLVADTFKRALTRLDNNSLKAAKIAALDLQMEPAGLGKRFHRIGARDPDFWSLRANDDIRLIVHKQGDRMVLAYVDHHKAALG